MNRIQHRYKKASPVGLSAACLLLLLSMGASCGDIGSSQTSTTVDNSTDNSLHGISKCTDGTSLVCKDAGAGSFEVTRECVNGDGSSVIVDGPDVETSLPDKCFVPPEEPIE